MNSKKSNKKQILLSVLALLVILLVGVGITYSWIEGGTTYSIQTENKGDVRTGSNPYSTGVKNKIILDPSSTTEIKLIDYDQNAKKDKGNSDTKDEQNLFFSPTLSANGSDFFFPTEFNANGSATAYRKATTNDIGTKFINFKFDVEAKKKCYIAFNGLPTISAEKSGVTVPDTSAFRVMIRSGNDRVVMTTSNTAKQSTVVTNESGATTTLTAQPLSNYQIKAGDSSAKLFDYTAGESEEMEVSVWLDGETADSDLIGSDIGIDMELIVSEEKIPITFDAVTYSNTNAVLTNGFTGGKIDGNSSSFVRSYAVGSTITATATPNTNYKFVGWYSNKECTTLVSSSASLSTTASTATPTYYAKFQEKPKYTITVSPYTLPSGTGGTVTVNGSGTTYTAYEGTTTTIRATASSGYKFVGWYTNSTCTGTAYSTATSVTVTISANQTYYAKFLKTYTVTFGIKTDGVTGGSGGTVNINGGTSSTSVSSTVNYNTSITLNASANEGYDFKGIYKSDGTLVTSLSSITQTITATTTYYAYFVTKPESTTTIYFETRSGFSTYSAYIYRKVNDVTTHYSGTWPGASATYDSTTGYYKYVFTTSDIGTFNVIVSNNGSSQYPANGSEGLVGTIGKTYLFKANNTLVEFDPNLKYTITVLPSGTGGSATVNGASSATVYPGTSVTISATASSGYAFAGWYTNSACTTTIGTNYMTASLSVTVNANATYYAKFTQSTSYTYYFVVKSSWNNYTVEYNNKWKSGSKTDSWGYAAMTNTGYTYNGNKIWSATFPNNDIFYNVAFKIMSGNNQVDYLEVYAGSSGMGKSSLDGKMYVTDTGQWINFTHN